MPPFCHQLVYETSLPISQVWLDFLDENPGPLTPPLHEVKGNPDPEGQIHESYAKTLQELKALAHQLWDQGDMLDEMRNDETFRGKPVLMESHII